MSNTLILTFTLILTPTGLRKAAVGYQVPWRPQAGGRLPVPTPSLRPFRCSEGDHVLE